MVSMGTILARSEAGEKATWTEIASEPEPPLRPVSAWADREALPIAEDASDFPHPASQ